MTATEPPADPRAEAEAWFLAHGLPWFVDDVRAEVTRRLHRGRVTAVLLSGLLLALVTGVAVGVTTLSFLGFAIGASVLAVWTTAYALWALHVSLIAGWALGRALGSLGLLLPLATRALPMLVLFVTFLFINSDVWQVASRLHGGILWTAILFFIAAALLFLVPRLAQEVDEYDDAVGPEQVRSAAAGTALEACAAEVVAQVDARGRDLAAEAEVTGLQRVNLVTALVVAQGVQVALLSLAVFGFLLVFGVVAITDQTAAGWIGRAPTYPPGPEIVSIQLIRVATFLAGFSGFYFVVTAITDDHYREEFFTAILGELRQAVGVRVVYRALEPVGDADAAGPESGPAAR